MSELNTDKNDELDDLLESIGVPRHLWDVPPCELLLFEQGARRITMSEIEEELDWLPGEEGTAVAVDIHVIRLGLPEGECLFVVRSDWLDHIEEDLDITDELASDMLEQVYVYLDILLDGVRVGNVETPMKIREGKSLLDVLEEEDSTTSWTSEEWLVRDQEGNYELR